MRAPAAILQLAVVVSACSVNLPENVRVPGADGAPEASADVGTDGGGADVRADSPAVGGEWVHVVASSFAMGSAPSAACTDQNETPHQVTLTHSFEMMAGEVTQGAYGERMGNNPSNNQGCSDCPVEQVSWLDAVRYCNALSLAAGLAECYTCEDTSGSVECDAAPSFDGAKIYDCPGYRLPTDAEFEYAFRAGSLDTFPITTGSPGCDSCNAAVSDLGDVAWYCGNAADTTHPVKQKRANLFGLHDLAGNVFEWCHDRHQSDLGTVAVTDPAGPATGGQRVVRGGSYVDPPRYLRFANRYPLAPDAMRGWIGFRCVRTR